MTDKPDDDPVDELIDKVWVEKNSSGTTPKYHARIHPLIQKSLLEDGPRAAERLVEEYREDDHAAFDLDSNYDYGIKDVDAVLRQAAGKPPKNVGRNRGQSQKALERQLRIVDCVDSIKVETQLRGAEFWERAAERWNKEYPLDIIKPGNLKTQYNRAIKRREAKRERSHKETG